MYELRGARNDRVGRLANNFLKFSIIFEWGGGKCFYEKFLLIFHVFLFFLRGARKNLLFWGGKPFQKVDLANLKRCGGKVPFLSDQSYGISFIEGFVGKGASLYKNNDNICPPYYTCL